MAKKTEFRDPVFVRIDNDTTIKASVVVWGDNVIDADVSIMFSNGQESILIDKNDWETIKACVDVELARVE